jgi:hypothetical protein
MVELFWTIVTFAYVIATMGVVAGVFFYWFAIVPRRLQDERLALRVPSATQLDPRRGTGRSLAKAPIDGRRRTVT